VAPLPNRSSFLVPSVLAGVLGAACSGGSSARLATVTTDDGGATTGSDGAIMVPGATDGGGRAAGADGGATAASGDAAGSEASAGAGDGGPPPGFWDGGSIPAAKNVMTFVFLNRTNGQYQDSEVYWSFKNAGTTETHSIAQQRTYDMPANNSGRMYFYLCAAGDSTCAADPTKSKYFDFIEHTIGAAQYNGNTTRVDAFGLKIAMRLHCADGYDVAVGEDYQTFQEDRAATFQKFIDAVPAEFKPLAQPPFAPYRIVQPGAGGFDAGGPNAHYYDSFVDALWAANGLTVPKPGPNGSGLAAYPDLSAAIFRHVGGAAGSFDPGGKLLDKTLWTSAAAFYQTAPADYYAMFWHAHALGGKAYGFPYDDVGGYSSYISHQNPQYMLVAIGW
jgi:Beta-1,3-glucanase